MFAHACKTWHSIRRTLSLPIRPIGHWCQGLAWSKDNRTLLVQCMVENEIMVFDFDGKALKSAGSIKVGAGPAAIRTAEP